MPRIEIIQQSPDTLSIRVTETRYSPLGMELQQYLASHFPKVGWQFRKRNPHVHAKLQYDILLVATGAVINEGVRLVSTVLKEWLKHKRDIKSVEILDADGNVLKTVRKITSR